MDEARRIASNIQAAQNCYASPECVLSSAGAFALAKELAPARWPGAGPNGAFCEFPSGLRSIPPV